MDPDGSRGAGLNPERPPPTRLHAGAATPRANLARDNRQSRFLRCGLLALLVGAAPADAAAEVKLGVAGPMGGANAVFGAQLRTGAGLAVADINKAGGILGQKLEMEVGDDRSDPRKAVSVANAFVAHGVTFVVGHFNSATSIPASLIYLEHDVLMITPSAVSPQVTEKGRWNVFRTSGRDDRQPDVAGTYVVRHLKGKKIAFLHDRTAYGRDLADATRRYVNARGVNEVMTDAVDAGGKDYSAVVDKLKAAGAEVVFWGGGQAEAGLLIRQMRSAGLRTVLMGGDAIVGDDLASLAGPGVEGTLMTFPPNRGALPQAASVVAALHAENKSPDPYSLSSYAAMQVLQQAAEKAQSLEPRKVAAAIHSGMPFATVVGSIAFDARGDVTRPDYAVYAWVKDADGALRYEQQAP